MPKFVMMSYNIEHMNKMFKNDTVKPSKTERAGSIAQVIQNISPHVLGICEAANAEAEHEHFIDNYLLSSDYDLAHGKSRGGQNLVFYYRDPFSLVSIDDAYSSYEPWIADINKDGLKERHKWERRPLEAVFEIGPGGPQVRVILLHTKSKGIFDVVDFQDFQKISLANRTRLLGQALMFRDRLDELIQQPNSLPIVVMGDCNDGPGPDPYEKVIGKSFVETITGSVNYPSGIFHNTMWWMTEDSKKRKTLWTADFPDPIVAHPLRYRHRVWIDHILVSPDTLQAGNTVRYVPNTGGIGVKDATARKASDHYAVYCDIETD